MASADKRTKVNVKLSAEQAKQAQTSPDHAVLPLEAGKPAAKTFFFAERISADDLEQMRRVIEEECERIAPDGW